MRHYHVRKNHVRGLFLEQSQGGLTAFGFLAYKTEPFTHGHAERADALLVIHHQQANAQFFVGMMLPRLIVAAEFLTAIRMTHKAFPIVFSTTEMNWRTRNGFSTQGAPVLRRVSTVSSLAISPVMNTIREASSGRFFAIQACTSAPFTPPGVRMSETTPRKCPDSRRRKASTPDSVQITE